MECNRFQTDGMRLLDNELTADEQKEYEEHVRGCDACRQELESFGRIVELTNEMKLRTPDDEFWDGYWESVYRRSERSAGFIMLIVGILAVLVWGVYHAVTSPEFMTYEGLSITIILVGLVVIFLSVVRERYHESKNDPYKGVKR